MLIYPDFFPHHRGDEFRPIYSEVGSLRSIPSKARTLLLTATTTPSLFDEILQRMNLKREEVKVIAKNPNR